MQTKLHHHPSTHSHTLLAQFDRPRTSPTAEQMMAKDSADTCVAFISLDLTQLVHLCFFCVSCNHLN